MKLIRNTVRHHKTMRLIKLYASDNIIKTIIDKTTTKSDFLFTMRKEIHNQLISISDTIN